MNTKIAAQTMIVAALGLIGDYSVALPHMPHSAPIERSAAQCKAANLKRALEDLRDGWDELDSIFADAIRVVLKRSNFDGDLLQRTPEILSQVRGLETALKAAVVPTEVSEEHMAFRRSVAKTRGRIAQLDSLIRQAKQTPTFVHSDISMDGLKALADFTTKQFEQLA